MAFLKLIGKYEEFPTFKQPFSYFDLLKWGWNDFSAPEMKQIFIKTAFKEKRVVLFIFGVIAAFISLISRYLRQIIKKIIPEKTFLKLKNKIYPIEKDGLI